MEKIRTPYWFLMSAWLSLILLGANLAIDLVAIPLNFGFPEHLAIEGLAASFALQLFLKFFSLEDKVLGLIVFGSLFGPRNRPYGWREYSRYGVVFGLLAYLLMQRIQLLPTFRLQVESGADVSGMHQQLSALEGFKLCILFLSAFVSHRSYTNHRIRL